MKSTMMPVPLSLNHLLERAGTLLPKTGLDSRRPDKTLARHSFSAFYRATRAFASALQTLGLHKGDRVATLRNGNCPSAMKPSTRCREPPPASSGSSRCASAFRPEAGAPSPCAGDSCSGRTASR